MAKTYGEQFTEAMAIDNRYDAQRWLEAEAVGYMATAPDRFTDLEETMNVVRENLGYMAGYYGPEEARHIEEMFGGIHPILGPVSGWDELTPEHCIELGKKWATGKIEKHEQRPLPKLDDPIIMSTIDPFEE